MKKTTLILFTLLSSLFFMSCASNDVADDDIYYEGEDGEELHNDLANYEVKEDFLGDFDAIKLDDKVVLVKQIKKLAPRQLKHTYLVPRKNTIEITFHYGANQTAIVLNQKERTAIKEAAERFFAEYDAKELHKHKVNSKTAYYKSTCPLYWGVASTNYGTKKNAYYLNYEIIDRKAYFIIHFSPTRNDTGKGNGKGDIDSFTPKTRLYLSPSQLKDFIELMDQDYLLAQLQYLRDKAYKY